MDTYRALKCGGLLVLGEQEHVALVTPADGWLDIAPPIGALIHKIVRIEQEAGVTQHV